MKFQFQIFLLNFYETLLSIVKLIVWSKLFNKITKSSNQTNEIIILGNGPSLKPYLTDKSVNFKEKILLCVNLFPLSASYERFKPSFYLTTAPEFWVKNVNSDYLERREKLFQAIIEKTSWDLEIFVPFLSTKHHNFIERFKNNANLKVTYFNSTPLEGFGFFIHRCFKFQLGMPRPHNVLIPSIMVASWLGFKKIYLLGADHSWLKDVSVTDQNEVLIDRKHFYQEGKKPEPMFLLGTRKRTLHEVLYKYMNMFKGYQVIEQYSKKKKNFKVYNATENSFIDAFERKKI